MEMSYEQLNAINILTSEWYNQAVHKFLLRGMAGKQNFKSVWVTKYEGCSEGTKPQGICCFVLCSTLDMKFQAIAIKCCLWGKENKYYIKSKAPIWANLWIQTFGPTPLLSVLLHWPLTLCIQLHTLPTLQWRTHGWTQMTITYRGPNVNSPFTNQVNLVSNCFSYSRIKNRIMIYVAPAN